MPIPSGPSAAAVHRPLSRRHFLRIGALGLGGLTLPRRCCAAEAAAAPRSSQKSVILIYLVGGPPHQDMFDLKPNAPQEIAGPWRPIATNVPGIQICEALPRLARIMDKLVVVRSLVGNQSDHDAIQVFNGHNPRRPVASGGWPQLGSAVARLQGPVDPATPPFISLCYTCTHGPYNEPGPGFLAASYIPDFGRWAPSRARYLVLQGITLAQALADRRTLAEELRQHPSRRGRCQRHDGGDGPLQRAGVRTAHVVAAGRGPRSVEEDLRAHRRSLRHRRPPGIHMDANGAPRVPQSLLMAHAGWSRPTLGVVTLNYSKWDWHRRQERRGPEPTTPSSTCARRKGSFPVFDQCVSRSGAGGRLHQARARPGLHRRRDGRVRPDAADQRPGRPRSLAAGQLCAACGRRHADGPGDRRDRPHRR